MGSNAVGLERKSRVVGYDLTGANFNETSPNLPQRVAILSEANHANQSGLDLTPKEITSAKQAGDLYGYGSPIHMIMRILRPNNSDGVGGIKTVVYPQAEPGGATARVQTLTPVGVATGNGTHLILIGGRDGVDGGVYAINVETGDTVSDLSAKIADAINAVLGSPVTATQDTYKATLTTKWRGLTAQALTISVDTGENSLGLSYSVAQTQVGAGTPSVQTALDLFGNIWNTKVLNGYGTQSTTLGLLEAFNGKPGAPATGRYVSTTWKPFVAFTGSVAADPSSVTDARDTEVTIAICPAPLSAGLQFEAAANMLLLQVRQAQDNPHLDVAGYVYPDMPTPTDIGVMADYNERNAILLKGCSTVDLVNGKYQVQDFVTTYHPDGEEPLQFNYVRNLEIDMNWRYGYLLKEQEHVVDHVLAKDDDTVSSSKVIKPKQWKQVVATYAEDTEKRALITDSAFTQTSLVVNIGTSNPNRFETAVRYKRSGYGRVLSTSAQAGF